MTGDAAPELITVRLVHFPLDLSGQSSEHFEGLKREFALLTIRHDEPAEVPKRLLELVDALNDRYSGMTEGTNRQRDAAIERGEKVLDELVYVVPPQVADACIELSNILDEADDFCRQGGVLLTLATPPPSVAFRRWYLGEFVAQARGLPPLSWPDADHDELLRSPRLRSVGD